MAGSGKWARTVVLSGPPETLVDDQIRTVARVREHFYRQSGYMGSHLLVDRDNGVIRSTGFWASRESLEATNENALGLGERMAATIWGAAGKVHVEVSEIFVLDLPKDVIDPPSSR